MAGDLASLGTDIVAALAGVVSGVPATLTALIGKEAQYFQVQAGLITSGRTSGQFQDDIFQRFLARLQDEAENFCRVLCAQTILTLEKAWNAVVRVIWTAINGALSAAGLGLLAVPVTPAA